MLRSLLLLAVTTTGVVLGILLGGRTAFDLGPFNAELRVTPAANGETAVRVPPVGALHLDTHDGPTQITVQLGSLDQARTQEMITDPGGVSRAAETVTDDVAQGLTRVGLGSLGAGVLGAMLLAAVVYRDRRKVAWAGGLAVLVVLASFGTAAATLRINAVEEPRYEGLLVNAPTLVGDVQRVRDDYERYTEQLQRLVANASTLYTAASGLETFTPDESMTRVLHVSDLHLNPSAWSIMRTVVEQYDIDFIIDTGDIVDWGTSPESEYLDSIPFMGVPYVYIRGNHDSMVTQEAIADKPNAIVLDGEVTTVAGLTVAGIGDPRFTPDQTTGPHSDEEAAVIQQRVVNSGAELAHVIRDSEVPVDVAAVHDPLASERVDGVAPVVLAGHAHQRRVVPLPEPVEELVEDGEEPTDVEVLAPDDTLLMVQGSTGGAGLRGLEGEDPTSLALSVLYFDAEQQLAAYDDITVGGHGLSEVTVQRQLAPERDGPTAEPAEEPTGGPTTEP